MMIFRAVAVLVLSLKPAFADAPAYIQLLWEDGNIEIAGLGPHTSSESIFAIASIGKTMTSVAILSLVDDGQLSLDDLASDYLPQSVIEGLGGLNGITIRNLLAMRSGLPDYYNANYLNDALNDLPKTLSPAGAVSYVFGESLDAQPGEAYSYSNTNYVLLGMIGEHASQRSYAQLLRERVFRPANMRNSFVFGSVTLPTEFVHGHEDSEHIRDYYNHPGFADGGVISTAPDLALFYDAIFFSKTLLSETTRRALISDPEGDGYGLGITVEDGIVGHTGGDLGFVSELSADLQARRIAIMLIADAVEETDWVTEQIWD